MVGGLIRLVIDKLKKPEEEKTAITNNGILFCSGMIAGEGLMGIALALLAVFGVSNFLNISKYIPLSENASQIASLGVFAVLILIVFKFSLWKKRNKSGSEE